MVHDVILTTQERQLDRIALSETILQAAMQLRRFLNAQVYNGPAVNEDFVKASKIIEELYAYYLENPDSFYKAYGKNFSGGVLEKNVCDFISGMTDRYAFKAYETIFLPQPWMIF